MRSLNSNISRTSARRSRQEKKSRYRYVYGLIPSKKPLSYSEIGIDGADVGTVHFRDIAAVVSDAGSDRYEILDHGVTHQKVVEKISEEYTILPMGFGQISTEQDIISFLSQHYRTIKATEKKITGTIELGLRAHWKMDAVLDLITTENTAISVLRDQIKGRSEKESYRMRVDLGRRIAQSLEKKREEVSRNIVATLGPLSVDSRLSPLKNDQIVMNGAFLVELEKEASFDEAVNRVEEGFSSLLTLTYIRSPPYSFINLRVK